MLWARKFSSCPFAVLLIVFVVATLEWTSRNPLNADTSRGARLRH